VNDELAWWPAGELARLIAVRRISAVELTELHLRRIERINPQLNAVVSLDGERALAEAQRADVRRPASFQELPRNLTTMGFLVHEVTPASNRLSKDDTWGSDVRELPERNASDSRKDNPSGDGSDQTSMNRKSAFPYLQDVSWVLRIMIPLENNIVQSCTKDGNRDGKQDKIDEYIFVKPPFF
jgi:hypothetical protein